MRHLNATVIIPTFNRGDLAGKLTNYLRAELRWQMPIIINDQSDDEGAALGAFLRARPHLGNVMHKIDRGAKGTSSARNSGAREARSEWLIFLDDDVTPVPGYMQALAEFIEENPWVDAVHGRAGKEDAWEEYRRDPELWMERNYYHPVWARSSPPPFYDGVRWFTAGARANYPTSTVGIGSLNFSIRRDVYLAIGGFDENIPGMGEDREIGLRLWWYGYRVQYCPKALVFHVHHPTGGTRNFKPPRTLKERLRMVEPSVGWVYFYMKWWPGLPLQQMIWHYVWSKSRRKIWTLPVRIARVRRALAAARRLLEAGPKYISEGAPISRVELLEQRARLALSHAPQEVQQL